MKSDLRLHQQVSVGGSKVADEGCSEPTWRSGIREDLEFSSFEDLESALSFLGLESPDRLLKFR